LINGRGNRCLNLNPIVVSKAVAAAIGAYKNRVIITKFPNDRVWIVAETPGTDDLMRGISTTSEEAATNDQSRDQPWSVTRRRLHIGDCEWRLCAPQESCGK
jgi:hypothetical protein